MAGTIPHAPASGDSEAGIGQMRYRPFDEREPDGQYRALLGRIAADGIPVPTRQGPKALTLMQQTMHFELANGFPVITERSMKSFWRKPIGELCAFINGATTLDEFAAFGCDWWGAWATPEKTAKRGLPPGDLGPGSYGGAFRRFPTADGRRVRPVPAIWSSSSPSCPADRTHFVSPWIPQYQVRGAGKTPADHDRAVPRLGARPRPGRRPAPAHVPAVRGRAGRASRPTWCSTPRWH